jgi:hypothetical protein
MVILGLVMLMERKILLLQNFQNKSKDCKIFKTEAKLPVTWQKYHYEIGFIQQDRRILGHAIPAKGKINFPVICKKCAKNSLYYLGH